MNQGYGVTSLYNDWGLTCFLDAGVDGKLSGKADDYQGNRKNDAWVLWHISKCYSKVKVRFSPSTLYIKNYNTLTS